MYKISYKDILYNMENIANIYNNCKWKVNVTQLCPTLCSCIVHGILQARILDWVAVPFSRGSFPTQGWNPGLSHCRWILYQLNHQGTPRILEWVAYPLSSGSF